MGAMHRVSIDLQLIFNRQASVKTVITSARSEPTCLTLPSSLANLDPTGRTPFTPAPVPTSRSLTFGPYEVNLHSGELRKYGTRIRLQSQPFQLLAMLLERPGEVVTREEICTKLWPADTFVDFDHSLGTAVNKIREVLNDSAAEPRFLETVPRR